MFVAEGDVLPLTQDALPDRLQHLRHLAAALKAQADAVVLVVDAQKPVEPAGDVPGGDGQLEGVDLELVVFDRVFGEGQKHQRRHLAVQQPLLRLIILEGRVGVEADVLDFEEVAGLPQLFLQRDRLEPVAEGVADVGGEEHAEILDLVELLPFGHPDDDVEAVDEEVGLDLVLQKFQLGAGAAELFLVDVDLEGTHLGFQLLEGVRHVVQLGKAVAAGEPALPDIPADILLEGLQGALDIPAEVGDKVEAGPRRDPAEQKDGHQGDPRLPEGGRPAVGRDDADAGGGPVVGADQPPARRDAAVGRDRDPGALELLPAGDGGEVFV